MVKMAVVELYFRQFNEVTLCVSEGIKFDVHELHFMEFANSHNSQSTIVLAPLRGQ